MTPKQYEDRQCPECKEMFTPTRINHIICPKIECVMKHRAKLSNRRYHELRARAERLKKLEPKPERLLPKRETHKQLMKEARKGSQSAIKKLEKRWFIRPLVLNRKVLRPEGRALLKIYNS